MSNDTFNRLRAAQSILLPGIATFVALVGNELGLPSNIVAILNGAITLLGVYISYKRAVYNGGKIDEEV